MIEVARLHGLHPATLCMLPLREWLIFTEAMNRRHLIRFGLAYLLQESTGAALAWDQFRDAAPATWTLAETALLIEILRKSRLNSESEASGIDTTKVPEPAPKDREHWRQVAGQIEIDQWTHTRHLSKITDQLELAYLAGRADALDALEFAVQGEA